MISTLKYWVGGILIVMFLLFAGMAMQIDGLSKEVDSKDRLIRVLVDKYHLCKSKCGDKTK